MSLPNFLLIGAQRAGTTSFFHYLAQHPEIHTPKRKELHYFDHKWKHPPHSWYAHKFPDAYSGEATPLYLFDARVPRRVHSAIPDVKLIALLRNPIDRAYSHYNYIRNADLEELSFEEAIDAEGARLQEDRKSFEHFSYLARGRYAEQLKRWFKFFDRSQLHVIRAEDFYADPIRTLRSTFWFLEREEIDVDPRKIHNAQSYPPMKPSTRRRLEDYFAPHNAQLSTLLDDACWLWEQSA